MDRVEIHGGTYAIRLYAMGSMVALGIDDCIGVIAQSMIAMTA
jgi:hypothetical protein